MDDIGKCIKCTEEYDDDPDSIPECVRIKSHLPVRSSKCSHLVCFKCVYREYTRKQINWMECMVCRTKTCFNIQDPIVDMNFCASLRMIRSMQQNCATSVPPSQSFGPPPAPTKQAYKSPPPTPAPEMSTSPHFQQQLQSQQQPQQTPQKQPIEQQAQPPTTAEASSARSSPPSDSVVYPPTNESKAKQKKTPANISNVTSIPDSSDKRDTVQEEEEVVVVEEEEEEEEEKKAPRRFVGTNVEVCNDLKRNYYTKKHEFNPKGDDALDEESSNHLKGNRNGNEEVKRESVREKMAKAREQALHGRKRNRDSDRHSEDDFDEDHSDGEDVDNERELSLEELKYKTMLRPVKSMYDMDTEASTSESEDERWEEGNRASKAQRCGWPCPSCGNLIPAQINGEKGGLHNKGNKILVPLQEEDNAGTNHNEIKDEDNGWVSIVALLPSLSSSQRGASTHNRSRGTKISIRRNILMDENDQCRQISLALFNKCEYSLASRPACTIGGVVDVKLCLLSMEEDEVGNSGFPAIVGDGSDDDLICANRVHTCIESSATVAAVSDTDYTKTSLSFGRANDDSRIKEIPLYKGMIGGDGSVRFRFDLNQIMDTAKAEDRDLKRNFHVVKLKFRHTDTDAALELRPPSKGGIDEDDDEIDDTIRKPRARTGVSHYSHEDGDDNDECNICKNGGYLIRCGGDDHKGGCGLAYHTTCINRRLNHIEDEAKYENGNENDEYENDDDCELEEEAEHEDGDENDECHICKHGGDLIMCDGGHHGGGCGQAYHISCINRIVVPPGDWICNLCAGSLGLDVGIEGHEWEEDDGENTKSDAVVENIHPKAAGKTTDEDSEGDIVQVWKRTRPKQIILDECDEDECKITESDAVLENVHPNTTETIDESADEDSDDDMAPVRKLKRLRRNEHLF